MSLTIIIEDLNEALHVRRYLQNFTVEVVTTDETLEFPEIQLFGTTEFVLSLPGSVTGTPTNVTLLYDEYSLTQVTDWNFESLSTSDITTVTPTIPATPTTSSTPVPTEPNGGPDLTMYLIAGTAIGVIVLTIIVIIQKKSRP